MKTRAIIFLALMLTLNLLTLSASSPTSFDDLIRWAILRAETNSKYKTGSYTDYIQVWHDLTSLIPKIEDPELRARAEFLRLKAIDQGLWRLQGSGLERKEIIPEGEAWLKAIGEYIYLSGPDWPWNRWSIRPDIWWEYCDLYSATSFSDDFAWEAASEDLPYECEGDLVCEVEKINMTYGRYLDKFPQGKYYRLALEGIYNFLVVKVPELGFESIKKADFNSEVWDQLTGNLRSLYGIIVKTDTENKDEYSYSVLSNFKRVFGDVVQDKKSRLPAIDKKREDSNLYSGLSRTNFNILDQPFDIIIALWKKLKKEQAETKNQNQLGLIELEQLICLEKMLSSRTVEELLFAKVLEAADVSLIEGRHVKHKALLDLHKKFKDRAVSDDIAFYLTQSTFGRPGISSYTGISASMILRDINEKEGLYLGLHPRGKYVPICLFNIIESLRMISGKNSLGIKASFEPGDQSYEVELAKLCGELKTCQKENGNLKIAKQALDEYQELKTYSKPDEFLR